MDAAEKKVVERCELMKKNIQTIDVNKNFIYFALHLHYIILRFSSEFNICCDRMKLESNFELKSH